MLTRPRSPPTSFSSSAHASLDCPSMSAGFETAPAKRRHAASTVYAACAAGDVAGEGILGAEVRLLSICRPSKTRTHSDAARMFFPVHGSTDHHRRPIMPAGRSARRVYLVNSPVSAEQKLHSCTGATIAPVSPTLSFTLFTLCTPCPTNDGVDVWTPPCVLRPVDGSGVSGAHRRSPLDGDERFWGDDHMTHVQDSSAIYEVMCYSCL